MEPSPDELPIIPAIASSEPANLSPPDESAEADATAWKNEVAARLSRYRTRRKAPPPRYPSLKLPFASLDGPARAGINESPRFDSIANQALAFDPQPIEPSATVSEEIAPSIAQPSPIQAIPQVSAKIIEFPRFAWGPPAPPPDQLAEPVIDRPRILDVPEVAPPAPALGGITIDPLQKEEAAKRPGIDVPLSPAPLGLRIFAFLIDAFIVGSASTVFALIFWRITAIQPPRLELAELIAGIPCVFWAAYQYLLIVYSGSTPGLRAAHLELSCFNGAQPRRSLRRWRVLASYLSAASLGMGYVWLFLDEDSLCWHDRITHTYKAVRR